jgi:hypothetical protein
MTGILINPQAWPGPIKPVKNSEIRSFNAAARLGVNPLISPQQQKWR